MLQPCIISAAFYPKKVYGSLSTSGLETVDIMQDESQNLDFVRKSSNKKLWVKTIDASQD